MKNEPLQIARLQGKGLVAEAIKQKTEERNEDVVKQVKWLLERIQLMQRTIEKSTRRMQLCQRQLEAVNSGKFVINTFGIIVYREAELNVEWSETEGW